MRAAPHLLIAVLLLSVAVLLGGCGSNGHNNMSEKPYRYDTSVTQRLGEFQRRGPQGAQLRLDQLTDFEWDDVYLFGEGTPYREIDVAVGAALFGRDGRYMERGPLLVFTSGGQVVHAVALVRPAPDIGGSSLKYARESAVLEAHTKDPGPYDLKFVETGGEPTNRR